MIAARRGRDCAGPVLAVEVRQADSRRPTSQVDAVRLVVELLRAPRSIRPAVSTQPRRLRRARVAAAPASNCRAPRCRRAPAGTPARADADPASTRRTSPRRRARARARSSADAAAACSQTAALCVASFAKRLRRSSTPSSSRPEPDVPGELQLAALPVAEQQRAERVRVRPCPACSRRPRTPRVCAP